jgi:hypothetical protein
VSSGERRSFERHGPVGGGQYQLMAQAPGRGALVSQPFVLADVSTLVWELEQNLIRFNPGSP